MGQSFKETAHLNTDLKKFKEGHDRIFGKKKKPDTKINLCDTCVSTFAECSALGSEIGFGDGVGNDNVIRCNNYLTESKSENNI